MNFLKKVRKAIKDFFTGGSQKKTPPQPRQNRDARNETVSTNTSTKRAIVNAYNGNRREEERVKEAAKTLEPKKFERFKTMSESKDRFSPKSMAGKSHDNTKEELRNKLNKAQSDLKAYHAATGNRYNVSGTKDAAKKLERRQAQKSQVFDPEAAKWETKAHPIITSAARGATSGASFGASDLLAAKGTKGKARDVEEFYQKNKNKAAETAGEIGASLASFGLTAGATEKAATKLMGKGAERAAERLAEKGIIQNAAKRSVNKAVKKGLVSEASEELIKQVGKDKATKIIGALGADVVQNLTTGAVYDINRASTEYEVGSSDWWKEVGKSAALNAAITTGVAGASALRGGKRMAVEAADELGRLGKAGFVKQAPDAKVSLGRKRRTDVRLPNERPMAAERNWREALVDGDSVDDFIEKNLSNKGFAEYGRRKDVSVNDIRDLLYDTRVRNNPTKPREIAIEDANNIIRESVPENVRAGWFRNADSSYKPKLMDALTGDAGTRNAGLNVGYYNYKNLNPNSTLSFEEWLNAPQTMYRGTHGQKVVDDDIFSAFTPDRKIAEKHAGAGADAHIEEINIRPIDTLGSYQTTAEQEFLVPKSVIEDARAAAGETPTPRTIAEEYNLDDVVPFSTVDETTNAARAEVKNTQAPKAKAPQAEAAPKGTKPAAEKLKTAKNEDVNQFAGVKEDVSDMGFNAKSEKAYQAEKKVEAEANKAYTGKSDFDKLKDKAYAKSGTGLNTDAKESMSASEAQQFFDAEHRTVNEHTKRGYSTIAVTGDKGYHGVAYDALKNGETIVDVYHDKENLAKGAQRVMAKADTEGGINQMIKDFTDFSTGKRKLDTNELRDQLYDIIAAADFANANKNEPWAKDLFLAACKAGGEQTSVSGLSLHMWQKMAHSSPAWRAKAVRQEILEMFNRSAGMRKALGKGKGNRITDAELNDILKKNPALEKVLDELDKMGEATSIDEVNEVASKALLHARKAMPMTAFDQLTQWRYVAMLSSPKTHVRNVTSNIYSATLGQLRDAIASSTEESLIKGTGKYGKKFQKAVKEGKIDESNYHKSAGGMSWKAFSDSHKGTKAGFSLNRVNSKLERAKLELEATAATKTDKVNRLTKRIKDLEEAQKTAQKEFDEAASKIKRGEAKKAFESWHSMGKEELVANAEKFERRQYNGTVSKGVFKMNDKMSNFIGNALETSDALSLERIYREKYDKILTANGWDELSKLAAKGDKAAQNSIKQIEEYAAQEAAYTAALDTYRNYNELSSALSRFVQDSLFNYDAPLAKKIMGAGVHAVMPFTKVPVNLMKRGIDYSPIGLMTAKRNLTRAIEAGDITEINRAAERLAEGRIGTGIAMLGAGLGFADPDGDLITGRLHDTDYLDKKRKDAGIQNYSVTLGDKNFTLDWATPTAASLFTSVEFGRMLRHAYDSMASENGLQFDFWKAFDVPMILASTTLEPTLQLGVFQGINDTLESVVKSDNYDNSGTNINPALKIVGSVAGNYINSQISPAILSSLSRAMSPYDYFISGDTDAEYAFNQQLAKVPFLSARNLGAKTNVWGQVKNEKTDAGDYAKSFAKNLLSPANINKVTWDETDEWAADYYKKTGYEDVFPKNNYKSDIEIGRIKGDHPIKMSNKEMAEYNVQRGKSGSDAIADALNTVVYNRYDKDEKGHRTIPHSDNITPQELEKLKKQFDGKGVKEVVDYIRKTPQFQKATVAEQKQVIAAIYGTNSGNGDESKGAKRSAERYIAGKKGISADEYDYYNETPLKAQENLKDAIESGLITPKQALDFTRGAGKTYYTTDERGEKGGTVATHYNKKEMMEYLAKQGYSYEEAEALYNAYKNANAKDFSGIDLSSGGKGYYRRGYRRYHRRGRGGGGSATKPSTKKLSVSKFSASSAAKASKPSASRASTASVGKSSGSASTSKVSVSKPNYKKVTLKTAVPSKSSSASTSAQVKYETAKAVKSLPKKKKTTAKTTPPKVKFKKYEV